MAALEASELCLVRLAEKPPLAPHQHRGTSVLLGPNRLEPPAEVVPVANGGDPLRLRHIESGAEVTVDMPGSQGWSLLAYDATNSILYLVSSELKAGWVRLTTSKGRPFVDGVGVLKPSLGWSQGRHVHLEYSPILGRLFVSGVGGSWWPFYPRRFHSQEAVADNVRPVPEAEGRPLVYIGDDPVAGAAVFSDEEEGFWHYDGTTLTPTERPLTFWYNDPFSDGVLLQDHEGQPWRWAEGSLTELDPDRVLPPRTSSAS